MNHPESLPNQQLPTRENTNRTRACIQATICPAPFPWSRKRCYAAKKHRAEFSWVPSFWWAEMWRRREHPCLSRSGVLLQPWSRELCPKVGKHLRHGKAWSHVSLSWSHQMKLPPVPDSRGFKWLGLQEWIIYQVPKNDPNLGLPDSWHYRISQLEP